MNTPSIAEILIQSVVSFVALFLLARLLGKRQIAQLTFFDYIVGITVGNIAASWSLDEVLSRTAIVALLVWVILAILLANIQKKSYWARVLLDGKPAVLIDNGKVLEQNLQKAQMSMDEFMTLLRQKDIFNVSDVQYAVMENNGTVTVMKKVELQPPTRKDMNIQRPEASTPKFLVVNGQIVDRNLKELGYSREWLLGELQKQGVRDYQDVFVAQLDSSGNLYVDQYNDINVQAQVQHKPLLLASLKSNIAELETYALQTDNPEAKKLYEDLARQLTDVVRRMTPYLQ